MRVLASHFFYLLVAHDETVSPVPDVTFHLQGVDSKLQSHCIWFLGSGVVLKGFWVVVDDCPHEPTFTDISSNATSALEVCPWNVLNWNLPCGKLVNVLLYMIHLSICELDRFATRKGIGTYGDMYWTRSLVVMEKVSESMW